MNTAPAEIRFTIVIPSYNRPQRLHRCLAALADLDYPRSHFSVIVVDDGSVQPLAPIVAEAGNILPVTCVRQNNRGPAAARNRGGALAKSEWVAFLDDDCRPDPEWLHNLAIAAAADSGAALGGRVVNALTGNLFAETSQMMVDYLYDYYRNKPSSPAFFTSNNLAFPTEDFRRIGGFDLSFPLAAGEDRELCNRWRCSGRELRYVPGALVFHEHDLKPGSFWRQHLNYGRGAWRFHQLRTKGGDSKVQVEPLTFYRDLLFYPLKRQPGLRGASASVLLLISQLANVAGYFLERQAQWRPR